MIKDFLKTGNLPTLATSFFYFTINIMVWVLMGVLGVYIADDFGLSASQKGLLAALPILGGSLIRIPLGFLVDHVGPRKTGLTIQVFVIIPLILGWLFSENFSSVLLFGLLLGVAGGSFAVALPLASRWYSKKYQGMALGIVGFGNIGTALASLFAPRLAEYFGWRNVFGLALIPVFVALVLFVAFAKEAPNKEPKKSLTDYFSVLKDSETFWLSFFYSVTFGGFVGLSSYLGIFFYDQYGLTKVAAGSFAAFCVLSSSVFRPVGGYLADRMGGMGILTWAFSLASTFIFVVGFLPPIYVTTTFLFLCLASLGVGSGTIFQMIPQRFQKEIGVVTGIVGAVGGLGGFFLPLLFGFFKETTGSYSIGFFICSLIGMVSLVSLQLVGRVWKLSWLKTTLLSESAK